MKLQGITVAYLRFKNFMYPFILTTAFLKESIPRFFKDSTTNDDELVFSVGFRNDTFWQYETQVIDVIHSRILELSNLVVILS